MHEIFVNYRTGDAHDAATAIQADLCRRFGEDAVFFASRSLKFGEPYPQALIQEVRRARVLLAVIGPDWLQRGPEGLRPLDDDRDWIRREIAESLANGAAVIPILVGRETKRLPDDLPADIKALSDYPYCRYDHRQSAADLKRIAEAAMATLPELVDRTEPAPTAATAGFSSTNQSGGFGQITMSGGSITGVGTNHGNMNSGSAPQYINQHRPDEPA